MLDPELRRVLDGTPIVHVATVLPDGAPHSVPVWVGTHAGQLAIATDPSSRKARNLRRDPRLALSLTDPENSFRSVLARGRVVDWLDGGAAWPVVDRISTKYTRGPFPRTQPRVVALIDLDERNVR